MYANKYVCANYLIYWIVDAYGNVKEKISFEA